MDENESEKLHNSIPQTSVKEPTLGDMWIERPDPRKYNELTEGLTLHVKNEIILNLEAIKESVKTSNLEMKPIRDEWIIYKPRK